MITAKHSKNGRIETLRKNREDERKVQRKRNSKTLAKLFEKKPTASYPAALTAVAADHPHVHSEPQRKSGN